MGMRTPVCEIGLEDRDRHQGYARAHVADFLTDVLPTSVERAGTAKTPDPEPDKSVWRACDRG